MKRIVQNILILNDDDMECDCKTTELCNITIADVGFVASDLENFGMIIYIGSKGEKILKSKYTKCGIIDP